MDLQHDPSGQDPFLQQALEVDALQHTQLAGLATSRRTALKAAAGGLLAAAGAGALVEAGSGTAGATTATLPRLGTPADQQLMAFLQSVSTAVAEIYREVLAAGVLSSPQLEVVTIFGRHHTQTGDAWDATLGTKASRTPNPAIVAEVQPDVNRLQNVAQALGLLFELEGRVVATYLAAIEELQATLPAETAATMIAPAAQRQVVLGQELARGAEDYLPSFESTSAAYTPAEYPLS